MVEVMVSRLGMDPGTQTYVIVLQEKAGARLLPMTDQEVETHVVVADEHGGERLLHFEEWWVRHRAGVPARRFVQVGLEAAVPAPGVLEALRA